MPDSACAHDGPLTFFPTATENPRLKPKGDVATSLSGSADMAGAPSRTQLSTQKCFRDAFRFRVLMMRAAEVSCRKATEK